MYIPDMSANSPMLFRILVKNGLLSVSYLGMAAIDLGGATVHQ